MFKELSQDVRVTMFRLFQRYDVGIRDLYFQWNRTTGDNRIDTFKSSVEAGAKVREERRQ